MKGIVDGVDDGEEHEWDTYDKCSVSSKGDWCVQFDDYIVKGTSTCVSDYSDEAYAQKASNQSLSAAQSSGIYCYCKMTSWTPNGGSQQNAASFWMFRNDFLYTTDCATYCATYCASSVYGNLAFRGAVFGALAN